ncbi:MAG: phosphatase PAP2 family protein [Acidobacteriota bacterium]|nr:phosphatase PAP2 family protein [Acidobacteriota bacterium]
MLWPKLRASEWVLIGFFAYISAISPFFPERPNLGAQPFFILCGVAALLFLMTYLQERLSSPERLSSEVISVIRDFVPIGLTLIAFREMEFFLPNRYNFRFETLWIGWDRLLLNRYHLRPLIECTGKLIPFGLEFSYLLVYGLPFYCLTVLYWQGRRRSCDRFLVIYLVGTLTAYALFPYFPSQPPRIAFPGLDLPGVTTVIRRFNLAILQAATIHVGVFPSAHVSSAFSAAWGMFLVLPRRRVFGWALVFYAICVSVATIYGRYHYAADVLAGFVVSLIAAMLAGSRLLSTPAEPRP